MRVETQTKGTKGSDETFECVRWRQSETAGSRCLDKARNGKTTRS